MQINDDSLTLPLPAREWLVIVDRDATIISTREIAYACYEAAFDRVVARQYPLSAKLDPKDYAREYNLLERMRVYKKYYPGLGEEQLKKVGEVSWQFYLDHCRDERFNILIPGMDRFLQALKARGNLIAVLTASAGDEMWMRHYRLPTDGVFSVVRMKAEKRLSGGKREAIHQILEHFRKSPREAVTIGDAPEDHVEGILSIGTGFGLDCPELQEALKRVVKIYVAGVEELSAVFGL